MAEYLASIFGTEKDKSANNPLVVQRLKKIKCSKELSCIVEKLPCSITDFSSIVIGKLFILLQNWCLSSWGQMFKTILLQNMYQNPQNQAAVADGSTSIMTDVEAQEHYDRFFEDVFLEMEEKYGDVEEMNVCDNLGDHLVGNVYIKFRYEEDAEKAVTDLNNRWYNAQPIYAELSPVTDFREACCRQYEMGECTRGGFCNFMHLKPISRELRRRLYGRRRGGAGGKLSWSLVALHHEEEAALAQGRLDIDATTGLVVDQEVDRCTQFQDAN
eukprot:gene17001-8506_t